MYVGALTVYSLVGTPVVSGWANVAVVGGILVGVPALVVLAELRRPRGDVVERLLLPPVQVECAQRDELARAAEEGQRTWWGDTSHEARWFDRLFVFWWKSAGVDADRVAIDCSAPPLRAHDYAGIDPAAVSPSQPDKRKAALVSATPFLSDVAPTLTCSPLDYELSLHVDHTGTSFRAANPRASMFGVVGWSPYPALTCTHNVLTTSDGWLLLSLRSSRTDFFPNTWSASFEEQIEVGPRPSVEQVDRTVGDAVRRGLREEFGLDAGREVLSVRMLALGREHVDTADRSVRSIACVTHSGLRLTLDDLWGHLTSPQRVEDIAEARGWMAVRFQRHRDVVHLLRRFPPGGERGLSPAALDRHSGVEVRVHPSSVQTLDVDGGFGWHPTSCPRLALWAEMAVHEGTLAP